MIRSRTLARAALGALALWFAGCGKEFEIAEVEGVVKLDGKPLPKALVEFHPDGTKGPSSGAETDDEGKFVLQYYQPGSASHAGGAVVGRHKVIVLDLKAAADPNGGKLRYPLAYTQLASTPLTAEVKPGKQTITVDVVTK